MLSAAPWQLRWTSLGLRPSPGHSRAVFGSYSLTRVIVEIQFGSQVFPPSTENACSKRAEVGVMSDQTYRTVM
jgi:hypothetical protein